MLLASGAFFCDQSPSNAQSRAQADAQDSGLPRADIRIGEHDLNVEIAATPETRRRGLMFRTNLGENQGMLFIFPGEERRAFWMKNTLIPLDAAFFDSDGRLVNVQTMQPQPDAEDDGDYRTYPSAGPARYVVETRAGWFEERGITRYDRLVLPEEIRDLRGL